MSNKLKTELGFLNRIAKRVFGAKDTSSTSKRTEQNRLHVLTIPEATEILEAYDKPLSPLVLAPWGKHVEFRRAAQFLYQKKALPDSFLALPFDTQDDIIFWYKNCLSVGLASGFIEPLESTAIHLVMRGVNMFLRFFPDQACDQALMDEYNHRMLLDYEEIRDFIVLHYCLTEREDTAFWRHCKRMAIPDSLQKILSLFKSQGDLPKGIDVLFHDVSWWSVCEGMGLRPSKYNSLVDNLDYEATQLQFKNFTEKLDMFVKQLPTHDEFIRDNCRASLLRE